MRDSDFDPISGKANRLVEAVRTKRLAVVFGFCVAGFFVGLVSAQSVVPDLDLTVYSVGTGARIVLWWALCTVASGSIGLLVSMARKQRSTSDRPRWRTDLSDFTTIVMVAAVLSIPALIAVSFVFFPHDGAVRSLCLSQIKTIALAVDYYHQEHGCLPPAYLTDQQGRPMHSWRVLILPHLARVPMGDPALQSLYDKYNFSESWDGPNNRKLAGMMPRIYACPNDPGRRKSMPSYLFVTGKGTTFPAGGSARLSDVTDGTDRTIFVIEVRDSGINWLEPSDMPVGRLTLKGPLNHKYGFFAGFIDGSIRVLKPSEVTNAKLRALSTIAGGEVLDPSEY